MPPFQNQADPRGIRDILVCEKNVASQIDVGIYSSGGLITAFCRCSEEYSVVQLYCKVDVLDVVVRFD